MTKYTIDVSRSVAEFTVRHMMITTVRGEIPIVSGEVDWDGEATAKVVATLDPSRIGTSDGARDAYLRGEGGFQTARYPTISFSSTRTTGSRDKLELRGKLTIKDRTKDVVLDVKVRGTNATATVVLDRRDFGVTFGALEAGGTLVGYEVKVTLRIALVC